MNDNIIALLLSLLLLFAAMWILYLAFMWKKIFRMIDLILTKMDLETK
jgi:hypothetical protein